MDLDGIKRSVNLIEYVRRHYRIECNSKGYSICPFHLNEKNPSFQIKQHNGIWRWYDWHCNKDDPGFSGTIVDLKAALENILEEEAIRELLEEFDSGRPKPEEIVKKSTKGKAKEWKEQEIERSHIYRDHDGKPIHEKIKYKKNPEGEKWAIKHWSESRWKFGKGDHEFIPYNLDRFKDYKIVIVCEGERDCDSVNALSLELLATSAPTGKGNWPNSITKYFKRFKKIIFLYDVALNEKGERIFPERKHAAKLQDAFPEMKIFIAICPGKRNESDITDYLDPLDEPEKNQKRLMKIVKDADQLEKGEKTKSREPLGKKFSARELLETDLPPEQLWIGKGLLPEQGYMIVAGHAKQGKTILCLQMSLSLVSCHAFLDEFPIQKKARVLYLFAENTTYGLKEILKKQLEGAKRKGWFILPEDLERFQFEDSKGLMLNTKTGQEGLLKLVEDNKPDIVFVDPVGLFVSSDILRLDVVTKLINNLNLIAARTGCTWILIHHYRKPQEKGEEESVHKILGSSAWGNYCESFLGLERAHKQRSMNFKRLHFLLRREEAPEAMTLVRNPETLLYTAEDASEFYHISSATAEDVVEILKHYKNGAPYTVITSEAATRFGVTKTRIQELLNEARDLGLAYKEKGKFGKWCVGKKTM